MQQENDSSWHGFESQVWRTVNFPRLTKPQLPVSSPPPQACPLSFIKILIVKILIDVVLMVGRECRESLSICGNWLLQNRLMEPTGHRVLQKTLSGHSEPFPRHPKPIVSVVYKKLEDIKHFQKKGNNNGFCGDSEMVQYFRVLIPLAKTQARLTSVDPVLGISHHLLASVGTLLPCGAHS